MLLLLLGVLPAAAAALALLLRVTRPLIAAGVLGCLSVWCLIYEG